MQKNTATKLLSKDSYYRAHMGKKKCNIHLAETKTPKQQKPVPFEVSGGNLYHFEITVFQSVTHAKAKHKKRS